MMKWTIFIIALLTTPTVFADSKAEVQIVSFFNDTIQAHVTWEAGPKSGIESQLKLEWRDSTTQDLIEPSLDLEVVLYMPDMKHGSKPTKIRAAVDSQGNAILGTYEVYHMFFIMDGKWEIQFNVKDSSGLEEKNIWTINLPR